jgi:nucleoside-diphosphate-sugar epimerase
VAASFQDPVAYARVHAGGTAAVVDTCIRAGVRRLVYVSSAEVYGQPRRNPVDEDGPLGPRSPYAAAKIGAEALVRAGAAVAGFEAVICRPFLVYGPGMPGGTLVASLIHQAQCGNVVEVIDPRPVRDYCFVEDAVRALVVCCSVVLPEPVRVYNLGSGTGLSVAELAERLLAMSSGGGSVRVVAAKDRPRTADILELVSDSSRAMRELGWRATIGIDVGLAQMLRSSPGRCS